MVGRIRGGGLIWRGESIEGRFSGFSYQLAVFVLRSRGGRLAVLTVGEQPQERRQETEVYRRRTEANR